jgi:hypothetical protein
MDVNNGATARLVIPEVHDGVCGVLGGAQNGEPLTVAFRWKRTGLRPELAGRRATLDGADHDIVSMARSALSAGFYVAVLARRPA